MFRMMLRPKDGGSDFPIYTTTEAEIPEMCRTLKADVVPGTLTPTTKSQLDVEQVLALMGIRAGADF